MNYTGGSLPEQLRSAQVSADFFRLFGAPIVRGRTVHRRGRSARRAAGRGAQFTPVVDALQQRPGHHRQTDFAERRAVHHRRRARGIPFRGLRPAAAGLDAVSSSIQIRRIRGTTSRSAGRLKPGVTLEQAKARLQVSAADYKRRSSRMRSRPNAGLHACSRFATCWCATCRPRCWCSSARSASCC